MGAGGCVSDPSSGIIPDCADSARRITRHSVPCHQTSQTRAAPAGDASSNSGHTLGFLRGHPFLHTLGYSLLVEVGYYFSLAGLRDPLVKAFLGPIVLYQT